MENSIYTIDENNQVSINDGVCEIPDLCFRNFGNIRRVVVPDGVVSIGYEAFGGCKNLQEIILPQSLESIGKFAFSGCKALEKIILPQGVKTIGEKAFENCTSLKELVILGDIDSIGTSYVVDNTRLQRHMAGGVQERLSFCEKCASLEKITIAENMSEKCIDMLCDAIDYTYCDAPYQYTSYIQGIKINLSIPCGDEYRRKYVRWLEAHADICMEKFIDSDDIDSAIKYHDLLSDHMHIDKLLEYASLHHNVAFSAYLLQLVGQSEDQDLL